MVLKLHCQELTNFAERQNTQKKVASKKLIRFLKKEIKKNCEVHMFFHLF